MWQTRGALGAVRAAGNRFRNRSQLWWDGSFAGAEGRNRAQRGMVAQACDRAFGTWEPASAPVTVTLVKSRQSRDATGADFHFGWDRFAAAMDTVEVDVDHYSLFDEPAIDQLASAIRSRIRS